MSGTGPLSPGVITYSFIDEGPQSREVPVIKQHVWTRRIRVSEIIVAILTLIYFLLLVGHRAIPDTDGLATAWESFLPWTGIAIILLGALGLAISSGRAMAVVLLPLAAWGLMFGPTLTSSRSKALPAGATAVTVASENIDASNQDAGSTASRLAATGAGIVAIEAIASSETAAVKTTLGKTYKYSVVIGTNGLWSTYPLGAATRINLENGLGDRAFEVTATTPAGKVDVFVAHLASVRLGHDRARNSSLAILQDAVKADSSPQVILAGDLNLASTDRHMHQLDHMLTDSQSHGGDGFGFTYPARVPLTRPDHIMSRGLTPASSWVLPSNGSDHRGIVARLYN